MSLSNGKPNRSYVSIRQQLEDWQHMAKEAACAAERVIADITAERDAAIARVEAADAERDEARSKAKDEAAEFIFGVLEEALGNPAYNPCDGTETWDGDVAGTVYRLLNASGVRNENTGELATTRAEAAEAQVAKLREALGRFAATSERVNAAMMQPPDDDHDFTPDRGRTIVGLLKELLVEMGQHARATLEPAHD